MSDLRWYTTLALWKSVVFMEGNYKRALAGATDDPYLKQFGDGVLELANQAEGVALGGADGTHRTADRLGRGADEQPVRLLPRVLRPGRDRPAGARGAVQADPDFRALLIALEQGELEEPAFELRFAELLEVEPDGLIDGLFAGVGAGHGDDRGGQTRARGGYQDRAGVELVGRPSLPARAVRARSSTAS